MAAHVHEVRVYYEDTDLSGVVYHANYLKFFERAREHLLGPSELVRLYEEEGIGFVVYKVTMTFREGARLGDVLEIRTTVRTGSEYRAIFDQSAWRPGGTRAIVEATLDLVCVDPSNKLVPLPESVRRRIASVTAPA